MKPAAIVYRAPTLPHQIYIGQQGWRLYVSCTCRHVGGEVYDPLEIRPERVPFPADEMKAAHYAHLRSIGVAR
jgi:hypothetical protein